MTRFKTFRLSAALALAAALFLPYAAAVAAEGDQAGVAGAVRGAVSQISYQTPDADSGRDVSSGDEVFLGDRIVTGGESGLQILLLDETTFTVGPNSNLVIDEFVYNPESGEGSLAASITRGALRYVSGNVARENADRVRIDLPAGATLSTRGTSTLIFTDGTNTWVVNLGQGPDNNTGQSSSSVTVSGDGQSQTIYRPGWAVKIDGDGNISDPFPLDPQLLALWLELLEGGGTGDGTGTTIQALNGVGVIIQSGQYTAEALQWIQQIFGNLEITENADGTVTIGLQSNDQPQDQGPSYYYYYYGGCGGFGC